MVILVTYGKLLGQRKSLNLGPGSPRIPQGKCGVFVQEVHPLVIYSVTKKRCYLCVCAGYELCEIIFLFYYFLYLLLLHSLLVLRTQKT